MKVHSEKSRYNVPGYEDEFFFKGVYRLFFVAEHSSGVWLIVRHRLTLAGRCFFDGTIANGGRMGLGWQRGRTGRIFLCNVERGDHCFVSFSARALSLAFFTSPPSQKFVRLERIDDGFRIDGERGLFS